MALFHKHQVETFKKYYDFKFYFFKQFDAEFYF